MVPWWALITGKVHKAVELLCQQVASKHVLPSSLRRRSEGTLGHHPQWFYTPCAVERGHVNGFLVYGRQWTRALEIHCLHFPRRPCCWGDWHRQKEYARREKKKKSTQTQRTKHSFSIFLSFFSFLTDFVKVSLGTKSETSTDVSWINVGFVRARRSCVRVCMCIAWLHVCIWKPGCKAAEWCKRIHVYIPSLPEQCLNFPN